MICMVLECTSVAAVTVDDIDLCDFHHVLYQAKRLPANKIERNK